MSEEDKSASLSDKDKDMANRYGGEKNEDKSEKDDDDDEKETKDEKRPPKRALFLEKEKQDSNADKEKAAAEAPKRRLFEGLLKQEAAPMPLESDAETSETPTESQQGEQQNQSADQVQNIEDSEGIDNAAFEEVLVERISHVSDELDSQTAPENADELVADAAFLEQVSERIEQGLPAAEAIDDALEDELEPPQADALPEDLIETQNFTDDEVVDIPHQQQSRRTVAVPPTPPAPPVPPRPPVVPYGGGAGGVPNYNLPSGGALNPNAQTNTADYEQMNDYYYRKRRSGDLLLGGVVGYLLGKRRGRRATEAAFAPEIRKKDDAISELKDKLINSEEKVREIAAAKRARESAEDAYGGLKTKDIIPATDKVEAATTESIVEKIAALPVVTVEAEKQLVAEKEANFERAIEKQLQEPSEPEKLGDLLQKTEIIEQLNAENAQVEKQHETTLEQRLPVEREAVPVPITSERQVVSSEKVIAPKSSEVKKDPRSMTVSELLQVADNIFLEKTSLRELYERNRIDAVNLRRVVLEYMNGGNRYEKVMRSSLEAVEMQRELRNETRHDTDGGFIARNEGAETQAQPQTDRAVSENYGTEGYVNGEQNALLDAAEKAQQQDASMMISTGTAVVLGVLTGIAITVLLLFYNGVI